MSAEPRRARPARLARWLALALAGTLAACTSLEQIDGEVAERMDAELAQRMEPAVELGALDEGLAAEELAVRLERPLSAGDCVAIALANSPRVRATLAGLDVGSAELARAGRISNPVFEIEALFFDAGTELEGSLSQTIVDLFLRSARERAARSALAVREADAARALVGLASDVRRAVVRAESSARWLAGARRAQSTADASAELMAELFAAGNVQRAELSRLEVAAAMAEGTVAAAEVELFEAREALNALMGLEGAAAWELASPADPGPGRAPALGEPAALEQAAVRASLDVAASEALVAELGERAGWQRAESWLADLELGVSFARETDGEWGVGPELAVPLPLFDRGAPAEAAARARLREACADHEALVLEVRSAARRLAERAERLRAQLAALEERELPAARRLVDDTLQSYNAMQIGVFDVLSARAAELDAERRLVETSREARLAEIDLAELLSGGLNRARLAAPAPRAPGRNTMLARPAGDH